MSTPIDPKSTSLPLPDWIALVRKKVEGLRYGVVQLVVHDGRVTQIESLEKTRLGLTPEVEAKSARPEETKGVLHQILGDYTI